MSLTPTQFAAHLDATNLRLDSTDSDLCALCDEAAESRFAAVCVYPSSVTLCSSILYNSDTAVGTVIGFPHGRTSLECKRVEVLRAAHDGANEVDIVLNYAAIRAGEKSLAAEEALDLCQTARQSNLLTKIIVETCYLNQQQKLEALQICEAAEADFIKTSTGFGCAGARLEDVQPGTDVVSYDQNKCMKNMFDILVLYCARRSWKLSRLTRVRASSWSAALASPGCASASMASVGAPAAGSTSAVAPWNCEAAAMTTQLVARKKGMN